MTTLIVIPAFNEEKTIFKVIDNLKKNGYSNILVVDDGSGDMTGTVAKKQRVIVVRHIINRGLGAALGTGFSFAKKSKFDSLVTFDADGQHKAENIGALLKEIKNGDADVVIGKRKLKDSASPIDRRIANFVSNLVTYSFFGVWTNDSQSGFRAFNRKAIEAIEIKTDRMEVSSEFFKEIHKNDLKYREIDIEAVYTDYSLENSKQGDIGKASLNIGYKMLLRVFR